MIFWIYFESVEWNNIYQAVKYSRFLNPKIQYLEIFLYYNLLCFYMREKTYRTSFDPQLSKNKRKKKCKDDKEDANDGDSGGQFEIIVEIVTRSSKNEKKN